MFRFSSLRKNIETSTHCLLDFLYPRHCLGCGQRVTSGPYRYLCSDCEKHIEFIQTPQCKTCGRPFCKESRCRHCTELNPIFSGGNSLFLLKGLGKQWIWELKYQGALHLLPDVRIFVRNAPSFLTSLQHTVLIPVPLHPKKLRQRGYNQSALLAKYFAKEANVTVLHALKRVRNTPSQTNLDRKARLQNVSNAFILKKKVFLSPLLSYVVIDDVFTTGATLNACCKVLQQAGARHIRVATLGHG